MRTGFGADQDLVMASELAGLLCSGKGCVLALQGDIAVGSTGWQSWIW